MVSDASRPPRVTLSGVLLGALRHPVLVSKIVLARLRVDPVRVAIAGADALPASVRNRAAAAAARTAVQRVAPSAALLLLDRSGRRAEAQELVRRSARLGGRRRRRLATLTVGLERPELTLDGDPEGISTALRDAQRAFQAGRLTEAVELLHPHKDNGTVRRRLEQYSGELAVLKDDPIPPGPRTPIAPTQGRVLHIVTNALPYTQAGYTVRTHRIVTAQRAAGLDPHVVTSWGFPMLQGHFAASPYGEIDGIPYHRLLPSGRFRGFRGSPPGPALPTESHGRMIRGADEVTRIVRKIRPAVLHAATDHRNGSVALAVGERTGLPVVYEVRGFLEETWLSRTGDEGVGVEKHRLQRARETHIMRSVQAVVTLADTMRAEIVARGVPGERVFLAPNAVDASLLSARPDGAALRDRFGIGADEIVVGSVSSIVAYEGFASLLEAAALLRDQGAKVRVLVVGDGLERPALTELAKARRLDAIFPGRVPPEEALQAHAALDIFVAPRVDARVTRLVTPLKPVEAMALGRPVVVSDLPALSELVAGGRAGILVPPGDVEALAKALAQLRDDPSRREELGAAGREEVAAHRTWAKVAETYLDVYRHLAIP